MFILPELKNSYSAYEPYIDAVTMELHHRHHHGSYVTKLNQALVDNNLSFDRIEDIFENIQSMPVNVRNNAGGHYNHSIFWDIFTTSITTPSSMLMDMITNKYGLLDDFKAEFTKIALSVFGSGWVWLVVNNLGELDIVITRNQDNPLMADINLGYPLFGLDMWEHAYYLKHQNRRVQYLKDFWSVLDWNTVSARLSDRPEMNQI